MPSHTWMLPPPHLHVMQQNMSIGSAPIEPSVTVSGRPEHVSRRGDKGPFKQQKK